MRTRNTLLAGGLARVLAVVVAAVTPAALAQDADPQPTRATTPAELLERLRSAGVELPEGIVVNDDGTVTLPAPPAETPPPEQGADQTPTPTPPPPQAGQAAQAAAAEEGEAPEDSRVEWKRRVELSLGFSEGNSEETDFRIAGRLRRTAPRDDLRVNAQFYFASSDGEEINNEFFTTVRYDRNFENRPRLLSFAEGRYDFDEFQSFRHRTSASSGLGYKLVERDKVTFILRGGAGITKEFDSERNELIPEALAGFDLDWNLTEKQSLIITHRTFFDLEAGDEFRLLSDAAWELALDDVAKGLLFSLGVQHEYQTAVDSGIERSDINVFASLGIDF